MKKLWVLLPVLILSVVFIMPGTVLADGMFEPLISEKCQCEDSAPDWGCGLETLQNAMNLAIAFGIVIATLVIAYAGAIWMLSPLNPGNREKGRTMLLNAVVGLAIVLSAWLFVDYLMKAIYNPGNGQFGPWEDILIADEEKDYCIQPNQQQSGQAQSSGGVEPATPATPADPANTDDDSDGILDTEDNCPTTANANQADADNDDTGDACEAPTATGSPAGCSNCNKVNANVSHKTPAQNGCRLSGGQDGVQSFSPPLDYCYVNASLLSKVQVAVGTNSGWRITEMWPPTTNHSASCHSDGTCVDIARTSGSPSTSQISEMAIRLKNQGLYVVYENGSLSSSQCQQILDGVPNYGAQVKVLKYGTQGHFSVYLSEHQRDGSGCIGW